MTAGLPHSPMLTHDDAEEAALHHLTTVLGNDDAAPTFSGTFSGVDIESATAVVKVEFQAHPVGVVPVQQIAGASLNEKQPAMYSASPYTEEAIAFASRAGVNLYQFTPFGEVVTILESPDETTQSSPLNIGDEQVRGSAYFQEDHDRILNRIAIANANIDEQLSTMQKIVDLGENPGSRMSEAGIDGSESEEFFRACHDGIAWLESDDATERLRECDRAGVELEEVSRDALDGIRPKADVLVAELEFEYAINWVSYSFGLSRVPHPDELLRKKMATMAAVGTDGVPIDSLGSEELQARCQRLAELAEEAVLSAEYDYESTARRVSDEGGPFGVLVPFKLNDVEASLAIMRRELRVVQRCCDAGELERGRIVFELVHALAVGVRNALAEI